MAVPANFDIDFLVEKDISLRDLPLDGTLFKIKERRIA